jgi:hypothetical protein
MMLDTIWPGPWYGHNSVGFVVTQIDQNGSIDIPAYETLPLQGTWYNSGGWFWSSPLLVASHTTYEEVTLPESYTKYRAKTTMQAYDFSDPGQPLKLPETVLPTHLVDVYAIGSDNNHFLYFEPDYRTIEVWGWDGAI